MFKNLFNRNKAQKKLELINIVAEKGEPVNLVMPSNNNEGKGETVLRSAEPMDTIEKNKSLLQLDEASSWEVKNIHEYNIGDTIDGIYKIAKKFSGGMGFVYITEPTGQGIQFAIKQPNRLMLENKSFFARIIREADTWNGLGMHPNIAYCYFVKLVDDVPCIFIEYVEGGNLREWIAEGQCLDIRASLNMSIQFCHGMEHAHSKGLKHRDIKPENVLMTKEGNIKITDFGLAGKLDRIEAERIQNQQKEGQTQVGDIMGTKAYMSPEQWEDPHGVDERADVFSFGICMWEMFCGRRPYNISIGEVPPIPEPKKLREELDDDLIAILKKSVALKKEERQSNFKELRDALNIIYKKLYEEDAPYYQIKLPETLVTELNNRGYSFYQIGEKEKAIVCWQKAIELDPLHLEATYNLSYYQWTIGEINRSEFEQRMRNIEHRNKDTSQYRLCFGWFFYEIGDENGIEEIQNSKNKILDKNFIDALQDIDRPRSWFIKAFKGHTAVIWTLYFSSNGKYALAGSGPSIYLLNLATGEELRKFEGHTDFVASVCFSPDEKYVLSGGSDNTLRLWDKNTGIEIKRFEGHTGRVKTVHFNPDGKYALSGSDDNTIRLWDIFTGKEIRKFEGHTHLFRFSYDGKYALSGGSYSEPAIILFDISSGLELRKFKGHSFATNSFCFAPNGNYILSGGDDKIIHLWDFSSGKELRRFVGHAADIINVSFSPDGKYVLSGSKDTTIRIWDVFTGRELRRFKGHRNVVNSVCFSSDGKYLLIGSNDQTIGLWGITYSETWKNKYFNFPLLGIIQDIHKKEKSDNEFKNVLQQIQLTIDNQSYYEAYQLIKKAKLLPDRQEDNDLSNLTSLIVKKGGLIRQFVTWFEKKQLDGDFGLSTIHVSSDGKYLLSGGGNGNESAILIRDIHSGEEFKNFNWHTEGFKSICFSTDGKYAFSGGRDSIIRLWDLTSGEELKRFEGHVKSVNSVCFSPDGKYVLSGSGNKLSNDNSIRLWDINSGKELKKLKHYGSIWTHEIYSGCFSPDGKYVVSGDKILLLYDTLKGLISRQFNGHTDWVNSVCFSPGEQIAESGSYFGLQEISNFGISKNISFYKYVLSGSRDKTIRLWDILTGKEIGKFEGHTDWVNSVCFSRDGNYILSGSRDKTVRLWDITTVKELKRFEGHTDRINSVCFSRDGKYALSGSGDKTMRLWDILTCKELKRFEGHTGYVNLVRFSSDGKFVLSGSADKSIRLWDISTGKELKKYEGQADFIEPIGFSFDGKYAISGSDDKTLRLIDLSLGTELKKFEGHTDFANFVCFSPDGSQVLSGSGNITSNDYTMRLWDFKTSKELKRFEGHNLDVTTVCFSPDGKFALSASDDTTICLWDLLTGKELRKFEGHTKCVKSVCFSPDGIYALSASDDLTVRLWIISTGKELKCFNGHTSEIFNACFSPDGKYVLSGSRDNQNKDCTVRLWDIATGKELKSFKQDALYLKSFCFSPDGKNILIGYNDQTIRLIELGYEYEFPDPVDWNEDCLPFCQNFLTLWDNRYTLEQFDNFYEKLQYAGLGWVRKEGVIKKLEEMGGSLV